MQGIASSEALAAEMPHRDVAVFDGFAADATVYNRHELGERYGGAAGSDADLLEAVVEADGAAGLEHVRGAYAVAWRDGGDVVLARDAFGIRPLWVARDAPAFASERRALEQIGFDPRPLHPRQVLRLEARERSNRDFIAVDVTEQDVTDAAAEIADLFRAAVERRAADAAGLLFSGGLDSTLIAAALQESGADFTCYTAGIRHGNVDAPRDVEWARRVADTMGLDLEVREPSLAEVEEEVPGVVDAISSASPVKVGVALPAWFAAPKEDVVLSGLGSEQLYAGYARMQGDLNEEGLSGLRALYHQDLYRDGVVAAHEDAEIRFPFLDRDLVAHALSVPGDMKVRDGTRKWILRRAAERLGVPDEVAWRGKTAAQYGSNFDKALGRLARDSGADGKQAYLQRFRDRPESRIAALFSGGKDSNAALHRMRRRGHEVACLVNLRSDNPHSYMFDSKDPATVEAQARALEIPLLTVETAGEKEAELDDLRRGLERAREEFGVDGVVAGALASSYQKRRVERVAEEVGLAVHAPLWGEDQAAYMRWLVREGFEVEISKVAARGLDGDWVGRTLDADAVEELIDLAAEHGFHPAGEGGGFETVVVDGPGFSTAATDHN